MTRNLHPYFYLLHTVIGFFATAWLAFNGAPSQWILAIAMYYVMVTMGHSIGYHRLFSHRVAQTSSLFRYTCLLLGHLICNGCVISWVHIHRKHHQHNDTENDPHSPTHKGYFHSMFLIPLSAARMKLIEYRQVRDIMKDRVFMFQHKYYLRILFAIVGLMYLIDPMLPVYGWLVPSFIAKVAIGLTSSYSHRGGRPHDDLVVGILSGGEGFHKAHHTNSRIIRHHKYDVGGWVLEKCVGGTTRIRT